MATIAKHPPGSVWTRLGAWFQGPLGAPVLEAERTELGRILERLFGYHIVQIGALVHAGHLDGSRIAHRVVLNIDPEAAPGPGAYPRCTANALPIACRSVDVVVLPHTLELERDGPEILAEAERILLGEGHLVIVGFNPWSLWGIGRLLLRWGGGVPWAGRFRPRNEVRGWLRRLAFEVVESRSFFYRPPLVAPSVDRWAEHAERIGGACWPAFGGLYVLVAKKRIFGMTPIQPARGSPPKVVPNHLLGSGAGRL